MSTAKFFRKRGAKTPAGPPPPAADFDAQVESVAVLGEPVRRSLYRFVGRQEASVNREQAAAAVNVPWHVAKFHLDTLVEEGLLDVEYRRPDGRGGPGAGRPTKFYRRSGREVSVSIPERRYDLAGRIMAGAITASQSGSTPIGEALSDAAAAVGRSLGDEALRRAAAPKDREALIAAVKEVLDDYGYESREDSGTVTLANCPFHALAQDYTNLVCGINLHLLQGMCEALGDDSFEAHLDPAPGRCCVRLSQP